MNIELRDKAVAKITEECGSNEFLVPFEEHLTSICKTDAIANKILNEDKTLKQCFENMKKKARERAKGGFAYIPQDEGFKMIEEYYDITEADKNTHAANVIDFSDYI